MMDAALLPALQDVLAVARAGSVGGASRRLHKTSSAVSQQVRRVEEHFGVSLFEKAGRGVRLSAAGEAALVAINRLYDEAESTFAVLESLSGEPTQTLRIAASDYLGKALLAPALREMLSQHARLRFEIVTTHSLEAERWVERGEVQLAVVTAAETRAALEQRRLFEQSFVWVGPRSSKGAKNLVERLAEEPLLRLSAGSQGRRLLDDYLDLQRLRPVSTIDVPNVSMVLSYALGGLGVGLVPEVALGDFDVRKLSVQPAAVPALPVALIYRKNYRMTAAVSAFVERLLLEGHKARVLGNRKRASRSTSR